MNCTVDKRYNRLAWTKLSINYAGYCPGQSIQYTDSRQFIIYRSVMAYCVISSRYYSPRFFSRTISQQHTIITMLYEAVSGPILGQAPLQRSINQSINHTITTYEVSRPTAGHLYVDGTEITHKKSGCC